MLNQLKTLTLANLRLIARDRILHAVLGVAAAMLLLVPVLSSFSMRQVQELAITLSLSTISLVLLVVTLLLGTSALWRDIERRYTSAILPLPISRNTYLLAKFTSVALFLGFATVLLGSAAAIVIVFAAAQYPSALPLAWGTIVLALCGELGKYLLLSAVALLLSTVSTSFFLPFFGTAAIFLAGSASQEVYEYVSGQFGRDISATTVVVSKCVYYILPNFAALDFKVHAVYALALPPAALLLPLGYLCTYTVILLVLAAWTFNRRELS